MLRAQSFVLVDERPTKIRALLSKDEKVAISHCYQRAPIANGGGGGE